MTHPALDPTPPAVSHIKPSHVFALDILRHPDARPALLSCFANGEPAVALVNVSKQGDEVIIDPLFLAIPPDVELTDHDGVPAAPQFQPGGEG